MFQVQVQSGVFMSCRVGSGQEVVHGIIFLPARVQPEGLLAEVVALRVQALLAHVDGDFLHGLGQRVLQQLEMHVTSIVNL